MLFCSPGADAKNSREQRSQPFFWEILDREFRANKDAAGIATLNDARLVGRGVPVRCFYFELATSATIFAVALGDQPRVTPQRVEHLNEFRNVPLLSRKSLGP